MKAAMIILAVLVAACSSSCASDWTRDATGPEAPGERVLVAGLKERMQSLVDEGSVPSIAVGVARSGVILSEEATGFADRERHVTANVHTPYPIASITKPLTATALMVLVEDGKIDLNGPIEDYLAAGTRLRSFAGSRSEATVQRVASHTAGLPLHSNHYYANEPEQPPEFEESVRRYGMLVSPPGERFQYSNLGYGLIGHAIEQVAVKEERYQAGSYPEFMETEVFKPLGMSDAFLYAGGELAAEAATKYANGRSIPPCISDTPGAADVYASVHDLLLFGMFQLSHRRPDQEQLLSTAAIERMQTPNPETGPTKLWEHEGSGCGLGWFIGITADGTRVVYHSGGTLGVSSVIALVPAEEIVVVVLTNTGSNWPEMLLVGILDSLGSANAEEFQTGQTPEPADGHKTLFPLGDWYGTVRVPQGTVPFELHSQASGRIMVRMNDGSMKALQEISYQPDLPMFLNSNERRFLRGWAEIAVDSNDVKRGQPYKVWIELTERAPGKLEGALICFSQRTLYTGPLSHWVEIRKAQ